MKNFSSWLKENKLDEVSAELLSRAATVAQGRGDPRGQRLGNRFNTAAMDKEYQEFEKDTNKIVVGGVELKVKNVEERPNGSGYKIHCIAFHTARPSKYIIFIDNAGRGSANQMKTITLKNLDNDKDFPIDRLNRRTAMMIAKLINARPTDLPLE